MKLLANDNNTNVLKVVIASKFSKNLIDLQRDFSEKLGLKEPKTVPQLILESGTHIFSSNSAAKFLFPPTNEEASAVNYFLDLESAVIQPLTAAFSSKISNQVKKNFEEVLNQLNRDLSTKPFLAANKITVADISIWCALYPLCTEPEVFNSFFKCNDSLKKWFKDIHKLSEVQESFKLYSVKEGLSSLSSSVPNLTQKNSSSETFLSSNGGEKPGKESSVAVSDEEKKAAAKAWKEKLQKSSLQSQNSLVLPEPGKRNILITSALPYVNNVPHLGNIIGCVLSGDAFARYCRLRGYNTLYICGTDEYGTATETKALEEGISPKEICDKYFEIHDSIYKWFDISFDYFGRTTTSEQTEICQDIFKKVHENGYVLAETVEQLLCEKCDRYLADRFVEGTCPRCAFEDARGDQCDGCGHLINATELINPRCKMCQKMPVLRESKQFFLDLPKIEPLLKKWIENSWSSWSHNAREISKAWFNDGLKPRCITRDLKWGIPVPLEGFQNKVFYVWFDAPIGYISITKLYTKEWRKWWQPDENTKVDLYQFMAKDNVPFHSVMFPASLIATGENYVKVDNIFATEYLNYEDGKFSKSRGIGVFGNDAQETGIPSDIWRFYLLYMRPESQDSSFSWSDLALKNNSELLNVLGNFINRALMFCEKNYDSIVPNIDLTPENYELIALVNRELCRYVSMLEKGKLREGIRHLLSIARLGNQLMQSSEPWVLCKGSEEDRKRCETVIGLCVNITFCLAQLLDPYMPTTANLIRKQLNSPPEANAIDEHLRLFLPPGHRIGKPFPLFGKIEEAHIEKLKEKFSGRQKAGNRENCEKKMAASKSVDDVATLEAAVAKQGDVVRKMKSAGKDKTEWGPEVTVLLELKKQLAAARESAAGGGNSSVANKTENTENDVATLEAAVAKQGDLVRQMKSAGKSKAEWGPEVTILLDLKKKLTAARENSTR